MKTITVAAINKFKNYLIEEEKSSATLEKYIRDVTVFSNWLGDKELCKATVLSYKSQLCEQYAPASVNAALSSLNCFFNFMEWYDLRVKNLKIQRQIFASTEKELTKAEYVSLQNIIRNIE